MTAAVGVVAAGVELRVTMAGMMVVGTAGLAT